MAPGRDEDEIAAIRPGVDFPVSEAGPILKRRKRR
jgi:hypothetical protein